MKVAIYGNKYQDRHIDDLRLIFSTLKQEKAWIAVEQEFYDYLQCILPEMEADEIISGSRFTADLALSIGGDGTFLRTAAWIADKQIPIAGINTGNLGYLAEVQVGELANLLRNFGNGCYEIECRSIIEISTNAGTALPNRFSLNEVAILKNASASMLKMSTTVDGKELTTYLGDGLIVSTPTGSTAYNLSVGGPILHPLSRSFVISPIAAHSLTMRPLVLPDEMEIAIKTTSDRSQTFRLSIDGVSVSLPIGSQINIRRATHTIHLLKCSKHDFARTLRTKLMWGADTR